MGAAGDMLTAALLELIENKDEIIEKLNAMGIPDVEFSAKDSVKCGVKGTHMDVKINGIEEIVVYTYCTRSSIHPLKYPAAMPSVTAKGSVESVASEPITTAVRMDLIAL